MSTPQNPLLAAYRAQQAANPQPAPPSVIMPPDSSPSVAPLLPPEPGPRIVAPRGTIPADSAEQSRLLSSGSGISQIHSKIENSGFGQKHPFLGKLAGWAAQIPAMAADIGVSSVAPQITTLTPGTEYHHRALLNQDSRLLAQDYANQQKGAQAAQEEAEGNEAQARTGLTQEQSKELPARTAAEEALQGAQQKNLESETQAREHPPEEWKAISSIMGPNGEPVEIETRTGQIRFGGVQGAQQTHQAKPDTPEQQYIDEYQHLHPGATVAAAERAYTLDTQRPPQSIMLVPATGGGYTAQTVRPGAHVGEGAQTASGVNQMNTPTQTTRTMIERAPKVVDLAERLKQQVAQQEQQLGPSAGRWNEFWSGKVGAPNPGFRKMVVDATLLRTALMQMHTGARGGEYIMKEFGDLLDTGRDSPQNMNAALDEIIQYAHDVESQQSAGAIGKPGETQSGGETRQYQGHTYTKGADGQWHLQQK